MESHLLYVAVEIVGWIYFASWTISFYPQTYRNWKRRSVVGFSFDYLALITLSYFTYSIYTVTVFFDPVIENYFHKIQQQASHDQDNTVKLTDVAFASHGFAICVVQIGQCFIYERGNQRLSRLTIAIVSLLLLMLVASALVSYISTDSLPKWAWTLNYCGYVKSGMSFIMCMPQIYLHFKVKSTKGWNILGTWLDFGGSVFSMVQMLLCCVLDDDNVQLTGNIPKLALSTEGIFFDVVFIFQHYIFYNRNNKHHTDLSKVNITSPLINSEEQRCYDSFAGRSLYPFHSQE